MERSIDLEHVIVEQPGRMPVVAGRLTDVDPRVAFRRAVEEIRADAAAHRQDEAAQRARI